MFGRNHMFFKMSRFVLTITIFALFTAFLTLAAIPDAGKAGTVIGSVAVALVVALYDFGLFSSELEV